MTNECRNCDKDNYFITTIPMHIQGNPCRVQFVISFCISTLQACRFVKAGIEPMLGGGDATGVSGDVNFFHTFFSHAQ